STSAGPPGPAPAGSSATASSSSSTCSNGSSTATTRGSAGDDLRDVPREVLRDAGDLVDRALVGDPKRPLRLAEHDPRLLVDEHRHGRRRVEGELERRLVAECELRCRV